MSFVMLAPTIQQLLNNKNYNTHNFQCQICTDTCSGLSFVIPCSMQPSITSLAWDDENVEHIARHRVSPAEVEQLCFAAEKVVLRAERAGRYVILGRTEAGRYLTVVVTTPRQGRVRVITARDMSDRERRRYAQLKGRS
jgi:uncharacterized DUF497 family protein